MATLSLPVALRLAPRSVASPAVGNNRRPCRKLRTTCRSIAQMSSQEKSVASMLSKSAAAVLAAAALSLSPSPAMAENELVGKWDASGLIFKDSVEVLSFDDPK
eukprot:6930858-Pyramimonas_sp.AAC.1